MQQNSFFLGCNYSNREITTDATTGWTLCPVQDIINTDLINRYGMNVNVDDTFSALYCDLYRRQLKQALKHTMLVQESVFESQIHELHRLYRRQKELMMEMERTRHHEALYLNPGFSIPRSHWMCSSISAHQSRNLPHEQDIEAAFLVDNKVDKSGKKVLDLELPVFECEDVNGEVHEASGKSLGRMSLESVKQSNKLQLDLNEPAKTEEHSDYVFNQVLSSVTSNEIGEEFDKKNEGQDSVKGSFTMNEAQDSIKCRGAEYGIDLNMSPDSFEDEVTIVKKFENEKLQDSSSSVSLHGEHGSKQLRVIVHALPCSNSVLLLNRRYKRGSRPNKKVKKLGRSKGFDLDTHSSAQATSESRKKKGSSSSWSMTKSARNQTDLGKKRRCRPQMKSSDGQKVVLKKKRKKSRRICLVSEGKYQEIAAAETIVDISRKSGQETYFSRDLLWFAEISTSVFLDYEIDNFEAMALELTEMKLEEHKTRSRERQRKRKCRDDQSLGVFSECEANEDLEVIGKLIEASESKQDLQVKWGAIKKRTRRGGSRIPAADFQYMIINQVVV